MGSAVKATILPANKEEISHRSDLFGVRRLRLTGLQTKLIVPYVILTVLLAMAGIFIVTRLVTSSIHERFINQIYEITRVASDAVVRQERANLVDLNLVAFTNGVKEALAAQDEMALEELVWPLVYARNIDSLILVNSEGTEVISLAKNLETNEFNRSSGTDLSSEELVVKTLTGVPDPRGDKFAGLVDTQFGPALFTGVPVFDADGNVTGGVLLGVYFDTMLENIKSQVLADLVIFDNSKKFMATTLAAPEEVMVDLETAFQSKDEDELTQTHSQKIYGRDYQITYSKLMARDEQIGWLAVVLPSSFVIAAESTARNTLSVVFAVGTVAVVIIGYGLSQSIAKPILRLRSVTQAVTSGDLEQSVDIQRSDEIGELAEAFDVMTLRLRERTQEAARLYAEAVQRNKELAETNERLRSAQQQLIQSEKLAAIGQLTAGIVHDVKNPIAVIKGVAEFMLTEDELSEDKKQEIALIRESALKANNIISDLLKFSRQSRPEMGLHDMRETVEASLRLTAFPIRKAHVQVFKDLPEEAVPMIYDDQQIEQVLVNLINNAVQAMPNGGTLRVNMTKTDGVAAIAVEDTGTGIPPENITRIFDPFFTTKPEGEGTGLGLSVSYGIISNHNGRIEVESKVGEGTTFTILIPMELP
jgi:signal transduction histidine kinase